MSYNYEQSDYIDVAARIVDFRQQYPNGSLRPLDPAKPYTIETINGYDAKGNETRQTYIVVVAAAYRTPDDPTPGVGMAYEVFPGRTNFTRGSELQNAETSAWGRAMVATLAADTKKGVASANEVRNRQAEQQQPSESPDEYIDLIADATTIAELSAAAARISASHVSGAARDDLRARYSQRLAELNEAAGQQQAEWATAETAVA